MVDVPILDIRNCTVQLENAGLTMIEHVVCAGGDALRACEGDSGGPLTCTRNGTDGEEEHYLCGIVSWFFSCQINERGLADVYTDVSKYQRWIMKFMRTWWSHYWSEEKLFILFCVMLCAVVLHYRIFVLW